MKEATGGVLKNLWPHAPVPETLHDLSICLDGAPAGIDEQVEMAARGGTDMALALVMSWYPEVKVDMLTGVFARAHLSKACDQGFFWPQGESPRRSI